MQYFVLRYNRFSRAAVFFILTGLATPIFAGNINTGLDLAAKGTGLQPNFNLTVTTLIQNTLAIVGVIFLILIVWGGISWMISGGNEKKVETAKKIITAATVGLVVVMMGYAITYFIISSLQGAAIPSGPATGTP